MTKRAHIFIGGRVQGVGFRMYAVDQAAELNLTGWIRNLHDGRVEIVAEGEETDVEAFVEWCKVGPESAEVAVVKTAYFESTGEFDSFTIRYG
jgi:acylphosphatase